MLKNASSLAIAGLDTAENGPSKVRQLTNRIDAIIGYGPSRLCTALRAAEAQAAVSHGLRCPAEGAAETDTAKEDGSQLESCPRMVTNTCSSLKNDE